MFWGKDQETYLKTKNLNLKGWMTIKTINKVISYIKRWTFGIKYKKIVNKNVVFKELSIFIVKLYHNYISSQDLNFYLSSLILIEATNSILILCKILIFLTLLQIFTHFLNYFIQWIFKKSPIALTILTKINWSFLLSYHYPYFRDSSLL